MTSSILNFSIDFVHVLLIKATLAIFLNPINFKLGMVIDHHLTMCTETFCKRDVIRGHVISIQTFVFYSLITTEPLDQLISNLVKI